MDESAANGNGRHSLAHELAVALMPEPSTGSKLLAEEFGIEYDEGAEGIDEEPEGAEPAVDGSTEPADQLGSEPLEPPRAVTPPALSVDIPSEIDPSFGSPVSTRRRRPKPEQDAMDVLAHDLEKTEKFLSHLRGIDSDMSASHTLPPLEKFASDIIRRINETARDREGQVRALLEYDREFRKIAGEVNGNDVLGQLDEWEPLDDDLFDKPFSTEAPKPTEKALRAVVEESQSSYNNDWETDPDRNHLGDEDEDDDADPQTPAVKDTFPPPPLVVGPPTPAKAIAQLTHLRTFTASLVSSLTTISEHTQINSAATAETGRKIRALKNKIGGWRTEWDSAEQSRLRIERWEAGIQDGENSVPGTPTTRSPGARRRLDGRKVVQEQLHGFEQALLEASLKTQAIMAAS